MCGLPLLQVRQLASFDMAYTPGLFSCPRWSGCTVVAPTFKNLWYHLLLLKVRQIASIGQLDLDSSQGLLWANVLHLVLLKTASVGVFQFHW
jgi:hypothetical protein